MPTPVTMPVLGLTMEEGTVAEWLKAEGETVTRDEPLLMVEMDKGTIEVPSPASGVLRRIVVQPGTTVPVRTLIAEIAAPDETFAPTPPAGGPGDLPPIEATAAEIASSSAATPLPPPSSITRGASRQASHEASHGGVANGEASHEPSRGGVAGGQASREASHGGIAGGEASREASHGGAEAAGRLFASPRARMRAREMHVELGLLHGRGPNGRIVEADVVAAASATEDRVLATPLARRLATEHGVSISDLKGTGPGGRVTQDDVLRAAQPARPAAAMEDGVQALSRIRRITAERMAASAQATARVTLFLDADFSEAVRFRRQLEPEFVRLGVARLPWDAMVARAVALALVEHPALMAQWVEGQGLRRLEDVDVGVAVTLEPEGLVVPVLRNADRRSLRELSADLLDLVARARAGRLSPNEMQGGAFTVTNLGGYRIDGFTPILNPPEAAILGVGRIADKPIVIDGAVVARTMCTLSLSFDHRVVDGAPAAAFLARVAELLERPYALLGI